MQLTQIKDEVLFHLSLGRITFLTLEEKKKLFKNLDNFHSLALLSIEDISKLLNRQFNRSVIWNGKENLHMAEVSYHYCQKMNIEIILHSELKYPELLRQIADPPYLLFCRGNAHILTEKSVSVVGTRTLSQTGKDAALNFGYDAVISGCNVISGLAYGADGFAHQGAVNAFFDYSEKGYDVSKLGKTIAVLPCAIDEILPYTNRRLAENILKSGGCLVSEYEPGMSMAKWHYVARNRIIAGMSPATVVIEAPTGSGALITADYALDFGRDVLFHEAAFGGVAMQISERVHGRLERDFARGFISKTKMENTPVKYLDAGAPVIKDYKDYCIALAEAPGKRSNLPVQGELF